MVEWNAIFLDQSDKPKRGRKKNAYSSIWCTQRTSKWWISIKPVISLWTGIEHNGNGNERIFNGRKLVKIELRWDVNWMMVHSIVGTCTYAFVYVLILSVSGNHNKTTVFIISLFFPFFRYCCCAPISLADWQDNYITSTFWWSELAFWGVCKSAGEYLGFFFAQQQRLLISHYRQGDSAPVRHCSMSVASSQLHEEPYLLIPGEDIMITFFDSFRSQIQFLFAFSWIFLCFLTDLLIDF